MLYTFLAALLVGLRLGSCQQPNLTYAFSLSFDNEVIGQPVELNGANQSVGVGLNGAISGPLLNATLVSLTFTIQDYALEGGTAYATSQINALFQTNDGGENFSLRQRAALSEKNSASVLDFEIGGKYQYLSQYVIFCYTPVSPVTNSSSDTGTTMATTATASATAALSSPSASFGAGPAVKATTDCYIIGEM